jgi:hypothetical protein
MKKSYTEVHGEATEAHREDIRLLASGKLRRAHRAGTLALLRFGYFTTIPDCRRQPITLRPLPNPAEAGPFCFLCEPLCLPLCVLCATSSSSSSLRLCFAQVRIFANNLIPKHLTIFNLLNIVISSPVPPGLVICLNRHKLNTSDFNVGCWGFG